MKKLLLYLLHCISSPSLRGEAGVGLFLLSYTTAHAQSLGINTTRFVGGDSTCGYSQPRYSIPTRDHGILFVGYTTCFAGGGDIPPSPPDTIGATASNVLIGKLDSNMNVVWVKVYGGNQEDIGMSAVQTPDGGYAVLGYTESHNGDVSGNHGTDDLWLVRIDSMGNLLWQKCYGSIYDEQAISIALAPDNGFIMLGVSNGAGDDVPTHYSGSEFDEDWFVIKVDSAGSKQWSKSIGGTGDEDFYGSILAANGGYYLVSASNSTDHDCVDTSWHSGVNTEGDIYIFRLDTGGNIVWDSSYGGGGGEVAYQAIWDRRDSSIVINGSTSSFNYMVTGNHGGGSDMWVIKTDKNGVLKWEKCLGSVNAEGGYSICNTSLGYMAYGSTNPGSIGHEDAWLFALDTMGNEITDKQFGGIGNEYIYPSVFPFNNGYIATGYAGSSSFTEGTNIGHLPGPVGDVFISYIDYWPLAIDNIIENKKQLLLYPNPTSGMLKIIFPYEAGNLNITNCIGSKIYSAATVKTDIEINTASWADGIYMLQWQGEDGVVLTKKFIKN